VNEYQLSPHHDLEPGWQSLAAWMAVARDRIRRDVASDDEKIRYAEYAVFEPFLAIGWDGTWLDYDRLRS
jgi:hypothetical protein